MTDSQVPVEDAPPPTQEDVRELSKAVYDMTAMMTEVVAPGLATVQKEKVGRGEAKARTRRAVASVLIAVLIAIVLNTLFVVGLIVPKCYNGSARGSGHATCNLIPGYKGQRAQSQELLQQFDQSQRDLHQNQQDLADEIRNSKARQEANTAQIKQLQQRLGVVPSTK